jgi:DNA-binding XRE family transcriptional regulator
VAAAVKRTAVNGLARRIRSRRRALGLAQGAFAERIGVTRNMVIRYEHGEAVPQVAVLARIARGRPGYGGVAAGRPGWAGRHRVGRSGQGPAGDLARCGEATAGTGGAEAGAVSVGWTTRRSTSGGILTLKWSKPDAGIRLRSTCRKSPRRGPTEVPVFTTPRYSANSWRKPHPLRRADDARRQRFTVEYKRKIVREADGCKTPGAVPRWPSSSFTRPAPGRASPASS